MVVIEVVLELILGEQRSDILGQSATKLGLHGISVLSHSTEVFLQT